MSKIRDDMLPSRAELPDSGQERQALIGKVAAEFIEKNKKLFERLADA